MCDTRYPTLRPNRWSGPGPAAITKPPGRSTRSNSAAGHGEKAVRTTSKQASSKGSSMALATAKETVPPPLLLRGVDAAVALSPGRALLAPEGPGVVAPDRREAPPLRPPGGKMWRRAASCTASLETSMPKL